MASIDLEAVSLSYPIYDANGRSLKNALLRSVGGRMTDTHGRIDVQALSDISLRLRDGDRLALVGRNGAGKTTLLKVLAGVYEPPLGRVRIRGSVSSLTDVTMGMDIDATGYENILMRCVFLGMTYGEAKACIPGIEEFTELGPYLSLPIRTYSTGMLVRLGFAASTASRPQILIMDEMIGAGDMAFADKAQARIGEYVADAHIMVLASHNNHILRQFCNKAILLDKGRIAAMGDVETVLAAYDETGH
jgi:ABC-2 type transport system ATP-binding protein/lipopolysaccharide transport system ATP-binding protein